jgi:hypothetical protein
MKKQTPVIKATNKPEWNHEIEFNIRYPSLVRVLKFELCTNNGGGSNEVILASEYVTLNELSSYETQHSYMPTFGPRHIDLYNQPNNLRGEKQLSDAPSQFDVCGDQEDLAAATSSNNQSNEYVSFIPMNGFGVFYAARLFMSISSNSSTSPNSKSIAINDLIENMYKNAAPKKTRILKSRRAEFLAFVVIDEVTMIDSRYQNADLNFQLTIGKFQVESIIFIKEID